MKPALSPTIRPRGHLRLATEETAHGGASGIQLSGVSKTYRSREGDVPSLRPLDFHINEGNSLSWSVRPAVANPRS